MRKQIPYSTPQGYFGNLQQRLSSIPSQQQQNSGQWVRTLIPVAAAAALVVTMAGSLMLRHSAGNGDMTYEDAVIEYLINSGTTVDQLADYIDNQFNY